LGESKTIENSEMDKELEETLTVESEGVKGDDKQNKEDIEDVRKRLENQIEKLPNVLQVDTVEKEGKEIIRVLVRRKVSESELSPSDIIPKNLQGYPIDVEEIDKFTLSISQSKEIQRIIHAEEDEIKELEGIDVSNDPVFLEEHFRLRAKIANVKFLEDKDIEFMALLGYESLKTINTKFHYQKRQAEKRVEQSISDMKLAFKLSIFMHNIMFYLGIALVLVGIIS